MCTKKKFYKVVIDRSYDVGVLECYETLDLGDTRHRKVSCSEYHVVSQALFMSLFWSRVVIGGVGDNPKGSARPRG